MPVWEIASLASQHDRSCFDCGQALLNEWLQRYASQWEKKDLARTYVAVKQGQSQVYGYYAISSHRVRYDTLAEGQLKRLPKIDLPVVLLGRLAVDKTVQGQGLGQRLLIDALRRSVKLSEHLGIGAMEVEAIDEHARRFYLKWGFIPLVDDPKHLFLAMHVIRKLRLG
jgi:GNAT superfamily N-acetyltransferase